MPAFLSILGICFTLFVWVFAFMVLKKSGKVGSISYIINLLAFLIYDIMFLKLMYETGSWGALVVLVTWILAASVHTLLLFIATLIVRRKLRSKSSIFLSPSQ